MSEQMYFVVLGVVTGVVARIITPNVPKQMGIGLLVFIMMIIGYNVMS